jgi:anti-sigma regulatory factor (Ser/Thr protein kinase)
MSCATLPLSIRIDSTPASIRQVRVDLEAYAQRAGLDESAAQEIGLCVNEALANVIRHAYAGATDRPIQILATPVSGGLRIEIRDWGNGFDPSHVERDPENDAIRPGGLGLICLRSLTEELRYEPQDPGMLLSFVKRSRHKVSCAG